MDRPTGDQASFIQPNTHSFVVKVLLADPGRAIAGTGQGWHGRITHVPSGRHHHFSRLAEIGVFISSYLQQLGVRRSPWWRRMLGWLPQ